METSIIYCGDCLNQLEKIPSESIDLIYIDPPFSSNRNYVAFWQEQEKRHFEDRFEDTRAYLDYMRPRLEELYRVLKETGSFYYHCDWRASHYIKGLLDTLFGYGNFRNEIIWCYRQGGRSNKMFGRKHESIFFYTKSGKWIFNADSVRIPYHGTGGYQTSGKGVTIKGKTYKPHPKGKIPEDWWDIPSLPPMDKRRLSYPTQKPPALLERIIKASSNESGIVLDAFCGCGTTIVVAQREKRGWIGIDISPTACRVMVKRLKDECLLTEGKDFHIRDLPKTIEELRQYPPFEFQNWAITAIGGIPSKIKVRDGGIDGKVYPVELKKGKIEGIDLFGEIDRYIPVQVKRTDQVGRPDIENFEVAMKRDGRSKGIFVGFDFSRDAEKEIRRAEREEGLEIEPILVSDIVEKELNGWL